MFHRAHEIVHCSAFVFQVANPTFASVVCVEAVLDTTSLHVKHIGAGRNHGLAGKTSLMARLH